MVDVFVVADNIISPLGFTTAENFTQLKASASGIQLHTDVNLSPEPFYASLFDNELPFTVNSSYTKFENLLIASVAGALQGFDMDITNNKTVLIVSSTKGNIGLLEMEAVTEELKHRMSLHSSVKLVAEHFKMANNRIVVSNACISGVLGIITGMRLIQTGLYENAVVVGADVISKFILSGVQSFQAISTEPCKPFDINRTGSIASRVGPAVIITRLESKILLFMGCII